MPIYEYRCRECQTAFECRLSFNQTSLLPPCPACQGQQVERLLSSFAAFSRGQDGAVMAVGGSACNTCPLTDCTACNLSRMIRKT